jgi:hypothetical protein
MYLICHNVQVEWTPYDRAEVENLQVLPIVEVEKQLWRSDVPMILYYIVEHHLPQRVMKQFGRKQNFPLQHESMTRELHE